MKSNLNDLAASSGVELEQRMKVMDETTTGANHLGTTFAISLVSLTIAAAEALEMARRYNVIP